MEDTTKQRNQIIIAVIIGLIVLFGIYLIAKKTSKKPAVIETTPTPTVVANITGLNQLIISDQFPGSIVYIDTVHLEKAGWVVVHADNKGAPGEVIGTKYFEAGTAPGSIDLTKNTIEGKGYFVELHADNGDRVYDVATDPILSDGNGNLILIKVKATKEFEEMKG